MPTTVPIAEEPYGSAMDYIRDLARKGSGTGARKDDTTVSDMLMRLVAPSSAKEGVVAGSMMMPEYTLLTHAHPKSTDPKVNELSVILASLERPTEAIKAMRELLFRADAVNAQDIVFTPLQTNRHIGRKPMIDLARKFGVPHEVTQSGMEYGHRLPVDKLRALVKRSSPPPVSQEALDMLSEDTYSGILSGASKIDVVKRLQRQYPEHTEYDLWDRVKEIETLMQAKGVHP